MSDNNEYRIIISGGGTGGHIFPAIAIADALSQQLSHANILFVGAKGRMEMEKVPQAGYDIRGLDVVGFQRGKIMDNLFFPFKLLKSLWAAFLIIRNFSPQIVIGVGGYASGPTLFIAALLRIPTVIQEQNYYPGVTNKILARVVQKIFVAYKGMDKFFPAEKIIYTGNPVRSSITGLPDKEVALHTLGWNGDKMTVFVMGGSLGARTINDSIKPYISTFIQNDIRLIWQTGKLYYNNIIKEIGDIPGSIKIFEFIEDMNVCYAAADIIISRAGALSISELCIVGKPTLLVPSPNVAEDHQTHNAMALVQQHAAMMIKDVDAQSQLMPTLMDVLSDKNLQQTLSLHLHKLAMPDANNEIATHIIKILRSR